MTTDKLDDILKCIDGIGEAIGKLGKRMDAYDEAAQTKAKDDADEIERRSGQPKPVVADSDDVDGETREGIEKLADAQARADAVSNAWGERAPAPLSAESLNTYRRRVLRRFQKHSEDFKGIDLSKLTGDVLKVAENRIFADALAASNNPSVAEGDRLREITRYDESGRKMTTFHGHPKVWMAPMAGRRQRFVGFKKSAT